MVGHRITPREYTPPTTYHKNTVETMSNVEIKHKLCKNVKGGCTKCGVYDTCRYGQEAAKRGLV